MSAKIHIAVVDDNPPQRMILGCLLERDDLALMRKAPTCAWPVLTIARDSILCTAV